MSAEYNTLEIVIDILSKNCSIEGKQDIFRSKENRYLLLLLVNNFRVVNYNKIKGMLNWRSDRTLRNNLQKAEEILFINKEFREKYIKIEESIDKRIKNAQ